MPVLLKGNKSSHEGYSVGEYQAFSQIFLFVCLIQSITPNDTPRISSEQNDILLHLEKLLLQKFQKL